MTYKVYIYTCARFGACIFSVSSLQVTSDLRNVTSRTISSLVLQVTVVGTAAQSSENIQVIGLEDTGRH